ncbi:YhcN/YlaJ family sporulation lipoprotein [Paenibacillus sp. MSJ-34]|uniref:YhcN/YlaJ family sporulation lipoprotein n=1 Tax=Paenibacillus sp. MSJ-34 TaxID=2841529 RepID=UPI001C10DF91|nr:YhcN/YlaJ family sporulation lipoprotein [Paenibacillus sp. MSJ-34]MBU5440790.1 YhcN/YlaJ family sporulation lipoprotein [Paenibacillus sp. MSJ-34]
MRAKKAISLSLATALAFGMVGLTGCVPNNTGTPKTNNVTRSGNYRLNTTPADFNRNVGRGNITARSDNGIHPMSNMHMSREIADRITALNGVQSANVLLTDRNAYVAVTLRDHVTNRTDGTVGTHRTNAVNRTKGMHGTAATKKATNYTAKYAKRYGERGMTNYGTPNVTYPKRYVSGMTGYTTHTTDRNRIGTHTAPHHYRAKSNALRTDHDGRMNRMGSTARTKPIYPTTNYNRPSVYNTTPNMTNTDVDSAMKDRIAKVVKEMAPHVNNVYVSSNPDLVSRLNNYMTHVSNGHPIAGFAQEFSTLVQRIFPTNAGANVTPSRTGTTGTGMYGYRGYNTNTLLPRTTPTTPMAPLTTGTVHHNYSVNPGPAVSTR